MDWMADKYGQNYAANSRETIRKESIHQFEQARLVDKNLDDPSRPTNSPNTSYQLTDQAAAVIAAFGSRPEYARALASFVASHDTLVRRYDKARNLTKLPLYLPDGNSVELSPGKHNRLQKMIVEEFRGRFAQGANVLYVGDTAKKRLVHDDATLTRLGIPHLKHDKLPDVVLYDEARNWLFLIEAVASGGPSSPKRHTELEAMLDGCKASRIYVTAFPDRTTFRKHAAEIAWESEVWIADAPDHMVHFNGAKFLGPYSAS